jgi:hypothetical protein
MLEENITAILKFLTVALASGGISAFLVQTDLTISWIAVAGLVGAAVEPWVPLPYGPLLFGHFLLASIVGSSVTLFTLWLGRTVYRAWN